MYQDAEEDSFRERFCNVLPKDDLPDSSSCLDKERRKKKNAKGAVRTEAWLSGAHFTCFTGTKVQILTQNVAANTWHSDGSGCSYVGGTHFSLLYLLYWYKSTSTDAESAFFCPPGRLFAVCADAVAC